MIKLYGYCLLFGALSAHALEPFKIPDTVRYELIYFNDFSKAPPEGEWVMEGPSILEYSSKGMSMRSLFYDDFMKEWLAMPEEERLSLGSAGINAMMYEIALVLDPVHAEQAMTDEGFKGGHNVYWLNQWLPENVMIEYDFLNVSPAGLYINFFSANAKGESIFSPWLEPRIGVFEQYTQGEIASYHISFGARFDGNVRGTSHLRVNPNEPDILVETVDIIGYAPYELHKVQLVKWKNQIHFTVDGVPSIIYDEAFSVPGFFGLRQMSTSKAFYKNLAIYELVSKDD